MTRLLVMMCVLLSFPTASFCGAPYWAVATKPAPVFNTPDTTEAMQGGRFLDRCGQNRALEFIALPGTAFRVEDKLQNKAQTILRVTTEDYPYQTKEGLFVDARFVKTTETRPPERQRSLPQRDVIFSRLLSAVGRPYVWGSNVRDGIPPTGNGDKKPLFAGLDCSGLLYEATDGVTPRNTSTLVAYGKGIDIAGLNRGAIIGTLQPLDLIVWPGHVIIVLDRARTIESRLSCDGNGKSGVVISPLRKRLAEIMEHRSPAVNAGKDSFVVRRWYGNTGDR